MNQINTPALELPNFVTLLHEHYKGAPWANFLGRWEDVVFSLMLVTFLIIFAWLAGRKILTLPTRNQSIAEVFVLAIDSFVCGILGPRGRKYTPFIGTMFLYIVAMNLLSIVPFMKSATANWSITLGLALCVFFYVQYTAFREFGFLGYFDHLMGNPRGWLGLTIVFPLLMFFLHVVSELIRPVTLSLRLRSNMWGDDLLLAVLASFGLKGVPLFLFSGILTIISAIVQAVVFSLLTTIYFALIINQSSHNQPKEA